MIPTRRKKGSIMGVGLLGPISDKGRIELGQGWIECMALELAFPF
jgi:hypothetical protein